MKEILSISLLLITITLFARLLSGMISSEKQCKGGDNTRLGKLIVSYKLGCWLTEPIE